MPESGHVYFVVNEQSGTAFDLSGADQRSVIGFTFKESQNQKVWTTAAPRFLPLPLI